MICGIGHHLDAFFYLLMEIKDHIFERGKFVVQNGFQTRFWEDWWIGNEPLKKKFPSLYRITRKKNQTIASVLGSNP